MLPEQFPEILAYRDAVFSGGGAEGPASLGLDLDPGVECVIEVQGRVVQGTVAISLRQSTGAPGSGDTQTGTGSVWRWKVRGLSAVDVDFSSPATFHFDLESIKVRAADATDKELPLSRISGAPSGGHQPG
jgi:hypothetical protein